MISLSLLDKKIQNTEHLIDLFKKNSKFMVES